MSSFEAIQSTRFSIPVGYCVSLPFAFLALFGESLTDSDGFRVDDVFTLFAKVSRGVEWNELISNVQFQFW